MEQQTVTIPVDQRIAISALAAREGCTPQTIQRWIREGVRGVKLEAMAVGARLYTSEAAYRRFSDRLAAAMGVE